MKLENDAVRIHGGRPLRGAVHVGPDNEVLESSLALAALAQGESRLGAVQAGAQLDAALAAWRALGAQCQFERGTVLVTGTGVDRLTAPTGPLDAGRSPLLLAQLAAVLCAQPFGTRVTLQPMRSVPAVDHVVGALRARGGQVAAHSGANERLYPPIAVAPLIDPERLQAIDATLPFADPIAKAALLLSGLYAAGVTTLSEPQVSGDALERLLVGLGVPLRRIGSVVALDGPAWNRALPPLGSVQIPGSASVAAHFAVLVQWLPGSDVTLHDVSVNPARSGVFDALRSWGAAITWQPTGDAALREPIAELRLRFARVRGGVVDAEVLVSAGQAVPALALLGPVSQRGVHMCELGALGALPEPEWRQLDPILSAFGFSVERSPGELRIPPQPRAKHAAFRRIDAQADPALALMACTLALASEGETVVQHAAQILAAVHPGFLSAATQLGASIEYA